jgi:alpha-L-arabinofuranosidase
MNDSSKYLFIRDNYLNSTSVTQGIWLIGPWYSGDPNNVQFCVWSDRVGTNWVNFGCNKTVSVLCESKKDDTYSTQDITTTISSTTISSTTIISTKELAITTSVLRSISSTTVINTTIFKITSTPDVVISSTIKVTSIIYTSESKNTKKMNISFWNEWSSWSLCQLYRQRNNSNMSNGIQYEILNVSCSLICE